MITPAQINLVKATKAKYLLIILEKKVNQLTKTQLQLYLKLYRNFLIQGEKIHNKQYYQLILLEQQIFIE